MPHPPQLLWSFWKSAHEPEQSTYGLGHVNEHAPERHTSPAAHAWKHSPQWFGSLTRFLHVPEHSS
jgi:hypothetical protein